MNSMKDSEEKTCHIISYKWWNMWNNFAKKSIEFQSTSRQLDGTLSRAESVPNIPSITDSARFLHKKTETKELDYHKDELERPGEINNNDIAGPIKGILKEGLRYMGDYTYIPNKAWECLYDWYGGGPEFERVLLKSTDGRPIVELYPPILYAMVTNIPSTYSYVPFIVTKKIGRAHV